MHIPRAYRKDSSLPFDETIPIEYEFQASKLFIVLVLIGILYAGLRLVDCIDWVEHHEETLIQAKKRVVQALTFPKSMAYAQEPSAGQQTEKQPPNDAEEKKPSPQEGDKKEEDKAPNKAEEAIFFDPLGIISENDVATLKNLGLRRQELDKREEALKNKEMELTVLEKKVDEKVEALKKIKAEVELQLNVLDKAEQEKAKELAVIYSNMKPKDAANIINGLDMGIIIAFASRMDARKLASIMRYMDPQKARDLTTRLSHKTTHLARHLKDNEN